MSELAPEIVEVEPLEAIAVRGDVAIAELPRFFETAFSDAAEAAGASGVTIVGPPFGFYPALPTDTVVVEAGFPVSARAEPHGNAHPLVLPGGRVGSSTGPVRGKDGAQAWEGGSVARLGGNIEKATRNNENFRTVLFTGAHTQLTVMRLGPGEDMGREAHPHLDQFLRIEQGSARVELSGTSGVVEEIYDVTDDWAVVIPAGVWHNVVNTGAGDLKLYSLYSPPEHPEGTVHGTKAEAEAAEPGPAPASARRRPGLPPGD